MKKTNRNEKLVLKADEIINQILDKKVAKKLSYQVLKARTKEISSIIGVAKEIVKSQK